MIICTYTYYMIILYCLYSYMYICKYNTYNIQQAINLLVYNKVDDIRESDVEDEDDAETAANTPKIAHKKEKKTN